VRRLSAVFAALVLALPIAIGAVSAQTGGTTASKAQRAEDMVVRGEEMRKRLDDFADGVAPCPQTAPEWDEAIHLGAHWKAYQEVRGAMKAEFGEQLKGTPLGQRYDNVLDGRKGLARALEARIRPCNPPESAMKSPQEILQLVADMIDVEKGLAGIIPLSAIDCPDCRREPPPLEVQR
jgi:hypothetical protein